jgi:ABC-type phosphate transport system permease subunit
MILRLLPQLSTLAHQSSQEDGSMPGAGLSALHTILYFVVTPMALFGIITGVVLLTTRNKSKK